MSRRISMLILVGFVCACGGVAVAQSESIYVTKDELQAIVDAAVSQAVGEAVASVSAVGSGCTIRTPLSSDSLSVECLDGSSTTVMSATPYGAEDNIYYGDLVVRYKSDLDILKNIQLLRGSLSILYPYADAPELLRVEGTISITGPWIQSVNMPKLQYAAAVIVNSTTQLTNLDHLGSVDTVVSVNYDSGGVPSNGVQLAFNSGLPGCYLGQWFVQHPNMHQHPSYNYTCP